MNSFLTSFSTSLISLQSSSIVKKAKEISSSMEDKRAACLALMNSTRKGNEFPIHSKYSNLIDMIKNRGGKYPSESHLDSFDQGNTFHNRKDLEKIQKLYNITKHFKHVLANPDDRSCRWKKGSRCIYRDTLRAGARIPFHPFIPLILVDIRISPCQLPPTLGG